MEAGMRRLPFLATLVGVVLLATGLMVTAQAVSQGREQQATLRRDAAQVAASFTSYFDRAHSLDLLLRSRRERGSHARLWVAQARSRPDSRCARGRRPVPGRPRS